MMRWIGAILTGLVASLLLFPFNLPISGIAVNTKMILAVVGAGLFVLDRIKGKGLVVSRDFLVLCIICALISLWAFFVITVSASSDYAFVKYLVSVLVWLAAAYTVVWLVKAVHGKATVVLLGNYMTAVCLAQCIVAYAMTIWPGFGSFIDGLMGEGEAFMSATEGRIHGLGAALDPSGLRFSAVLVILAVFMVKTDYGTQTWKGLFYVVSFLVITIIGNMISRSTTIGALIAIVLLLVLLWPRGGIVHLNRYWLIISGGVILILALTVWLYHTVPAFRYNVRFGFEGFFSLVEKGRWETRSTSILESMVVWPETVRTWIIGDGFFDNPKDVPDQFGQLYGGFYMKTDIGYLRYIFYFGTIGLLGMVAAVVAMTRTCIRHFKEYRLMFLSMLLVTFIGWFKVSSDVIMFFAPFLILAYMESEEDNGEPCTSSIT